jgi:hypothetical protein
MTECAEGNPGFGDEAEMKKSLILALGAVLAVCSLTTMSNAGPIGTACMRSDRDASNRAMCNCIQQVADITLNGNDQRRAAKFFSNPDLAHSTWVSQRPGDDAFWDRYVAFGAQAEAYCAG